MLRRANNYLNKESKRYTLPPQLLRIDLFLWEYGSSRSHRSTSLLANLRNRRFCESSAAAVKCFAPSGENNALERRKSPASNHITSKCGDVKSRVQAHERKMHRNIQEVHTRDPRPKNPTWPQPTRNVTEKTSPLNPTWPQSTRNVTKITSPWFPTRQLLQLSALKHIHKSSKKLTILLSYSDGKTTSSHEGPAHVPNI